MMMLGLVLSFELLVGEFQNRIFPIYALYRYDYSTPVTSSPDGLPQLSPGVTVGKSDHLAASTTAETSSGVSIT